MTRTLLCPYCRAGRNEKCKPGCSQVYRQEAGLTKRDGSDYLREFWLERGAPNALNEEAVDTFGPFAVGDVVVAYMVHDGIPSLVTTTLLAIDRDSQRPYLVADDLTAAGRYACTRSEIKPPRKDT